MESKVLYAIDKYKMFKEGDAVVVGVSGGADSMALVNFLLSISDIMNLKIIVVHVNHCLRGEESDRDEKFVLRFCKRNGIDFYSYKIDVREGSKCERLGLEDYGRKERYRCFNEVAEKYDAKIATAHTLSDSVETTLFNLVRGTGLKGLMGIPPVRGNIVRPLIFVTRNMIERYCLENKIDYINDSSNLSDEYTRNKIRLGIIPQIKKINPSFEESFLRLKENIEEEYDYFENLVSREMHKVCIEKDKYDLNYLSSLHRTLKSKIVIELLRKHYGVNLEKSHVDLICGIIDSKTGAATVPGNIYVKAEKNYLRVFRDIKKIYDWEMKFKIGEVLTDSGKKFIIKVIDKNKYFKIKEKDRDLFCKSLDYGKITCGAIFRNRRPGDKFKPQGRNVTKTLKKLFNEAGVALEKRDELVILESDGVILWVEGFGVSEYAAITENTKKILIILAEGRTK